MEKDMGKTTQKRYVGNNRYCLEKTLGKGGFGITWLAVDQENEQKVVIKELYGLFTTAGLLPDTVRTLLW